MIHSVVEKRHDVGPAVTKILFSKTLEDVEVEVDLILAIIAISIETVELHDHETGS